jgi:hypothetical protein
MSIQKHHIIPKHAGGTNDPTNLIPVTIQEHAECHRRLWEQHGMIEDKVAWLALSGQSDAFDEARKELIRQKLSGVPKTPEHRAKISAALKGRVRPFRSRSGRPMTQAHKDAIRKAHLGKTLSAEHRANLSKAKLGNRNAAGHKGRNQYHTAYFPANEFVAGLKVW